MSTDRDPPSEHPESPENRASESPPTSAEEGAVSTARDAPPSTPAGESRTAAKAGSSGSGTPGEGPKVHVPKGAYYVSLESFEGPLDLLLHLIQQHELDIADIPIAFISEKYVEYLHHMQELNIDLASEYLVMAATLAHIKSKMLLPTPPAGQEDDAADEIDPRAELIRRLLEYQKYKQASQQLAGAPVLGRDVFVRGTSAPEVDGPAPLAQLSIFKLFDAFQRMLGRVKQTAEHLIDVDRISISERIIQLTDKLKGLGKVHFEQLFDEDAGRSELVVTFLALLEMTRLRMMRVTQEGPLEDIFVELTITEEQEEVLRREAGDGDPVAQLSRADQGEPLPSPAGGQAGEAEEPLPDSVEPEPLAEAETPADPREAFPVSHESDGGAPSSSQRAPDAAGSSAADGRDPALRSSLSNATPESQE